MFRTKFVLIIGRQSTQSGSEKMRDLLDMKIGRDSFLLWQEQEREGAHIRRPALILFGRDGVADTLVLLVIRR